MATHVEFEDNAVYVFRDYDQTTVIAARNAYGWRATAYRGKSIVALSASEHHLTALGALKDAHRVADKASRHEA